MIATQRRRSTAAFLGRVAAAALAAQLVGAAAWASEGGAGGNPWLPLLWKAINFALLVGIIWYYGRKPVRAMLVGAARQARVTLDEHRDWARQAEEELAEQGRRIAGLQSELERLLEESRQEARQEHDRLLAEARSAAERIKGAVQMQVEHELNRSRKELQAALADQTVRLAEQLIIQRLDAPARNRIVTQAIEQLGASS
jgi:F-type H+-transporting ATPase subunit b